MTTVVPDRLAPSTTVPVSGAPHVRPTRRVLNGVTADDRFVVVGAAASALALAWLVCYQLLPWGTLPAFVVTAFVLFLAVIGVGTAVTTPGPMVADRVASVVVTGGAALVALGLVSAIVFVFVRGWPALWHWNMWTDDMAGVGPRDDITKGGVAHAVVGSFVQIGIAVLITLPLGFGTAVFMTEIGGPFARVVRTVVEAMTALPSIVAGLFVYTTLIITLGMPRSGFAAATALSVMMLPIIARSADVVLRVIPSGLREASLALGASRWRTVWHVVLPTARPGLATAMILGVARGVGETSPVLLTSGAASFFVWNPFDGVMNSLPLFIFSGVRSGEPEAIERAFAAASILLMLVLLLFVTARRLARTRKSR